MRVSNFKKEEVDLDIVITDDTVGKTTGVVKLMKLFDNSGTFRRNFTF